MTVLTKVLLSLFVFFCNLFFLKILGNIVIFAVHKFSLKFLVYFKQFVVIQVDCLCLHIFSALHIYGSSGPTFAFWTVEHYSEVEIKLKWAEMKRSTSIFGNFNIA